MAVCERGGRMIEVENLKSDVGKHVLIGLIDEYNRQLEETDENE